jgi:hypothetical protein
VVPASPPFGDGLWATRWGVSLLWNWVDLSYANTVSAARSLADYWGAGRPPKALLQRLRRKLREGGNPRSDDPGWSTELRRCQPQDLGVHCSTTELLGTYEVSATYLFSLSR